MPRYYRRRRYVRSGRSKYSNQTLTFNATTGEITAGDTFPFDGTAEAVTARGVLVVPSTSVFGVRKVKNFDITVTTSSMTSPVIAMLVYVPEGTIANPIHSISQEASSAVAYEPNQNVIGTFVIPPSLSGDSGNAVVTRFKTKLARNLDNGDEIRLIFSNYAQIEEGATFSGYVNYAIKY